jgi:hypothetical protein
MAHARTFQASRDPYVLSSGRTWSRASVFDDDGLKTSIATSTSLATFSTLAAFTGVEGGLLFGGKGPARSIVVTGAGAGSFIAGAGVTIVGWRDKTSVTERLTWGSVNGAVLRFQNLLDGIESVTIEANTNAGGTIKLGVGDVAPAKMSSIMAIRIRAAGTLWVRYGATLPTADTDLDDGIIVTGDTTENISPERILAGSDASHATTTGVAVTVYF